jgi:hypothetical protein
MLEQRPYATFVVELLLGQDGGVRRTRVVHVQTGAEQKWAGWDEERLLAFLGPAGPRSMNNRGSMPPNS